MELYISDHPLDCLTCSANGDCELQDMAGAVGLREVRYGYDGDNHLERGQGRVQPLFHLRPVEMHRLLALRARLRGGAGHLRADHRRPRLRLRSSRRAWRALPRFRMRLLRRLRAGLPDGDAAREVGHRDRHAEHSVVTTCAYCGVGCSFKAEMRGDEVVRMVPYKDGKANRGHSCVKGRFAWGYATHKDRILKPMIRENDHRPLARGELGRGDRLRRLRVPAHPGRSTASARSAASPRRAAPTRRPSSSRSWSAPASATTMSTPAPASATRRPATASRPPSAPRPARRTSTRSSRPTSSSSSAPTRPTAIRSSPRG